MNKDKQYQSKYWICDNCAKAKQWKAPRWATTATRGKCAWCKSGLDVNLTSVLDFTGIEKRAIWDI